MSLKQKTMRHLTVFWAMALATFVIVHLTLTMSPTDSVGAAAMIGLAGNVVTWLLSRKK